MIEKLAIENVAHLHVQVGKWNDMEEVVPIGNEKWQSRMGRGQDRSKELNSHGRWSFRHTCIRCGRRSAREHVGQVSWFQVYGNITESRSEQLEEECFVESMLCQYELILMDSRFCVGSVQFSKG